MCEILVQIADRQGDDLYKTCALPQAGDVIVVMEDGQAWGTQELTNPNWRIFSLPGVAPAVFGNLLSPEMPTTPILQGIVPPRTLQYRGFRFDLTKLAALPAVQTVLQTRTAPIIRLPVATIRAALLAAVAKRDAIADPAVVGSNPAVIG